MRVESFLDRDAVVDLSFFNFRNAVTAAYFADANLRILKVNDNFLSFFPVLGNVSNAYFPDVLAQLGVEPGTIAHFNDQLATVGKVIIPSISIRTDGQDRVYLLTSTRTTDASFSYLNGVQGQFVDRTAEFELRRERERLIEEKLRDREVIEEKTRQLERLADRLAKYLSPQIYASIFTGATEPKQGFARKNLTVFVSDIEHFSDISDGMEPERLAFVINTYLSEMSAIAIDHGGTIDKFIGDAILVFFGDPETEGDREDALKCARMALRMMERVAELESLWRAHGISQPVKVRMGINTGFCTVGNFGSDQRLEYTVLGSPVNLAFRLEARAEPNTILVSESTYALIQDAAETTPADAVTPKGFVRPVQTYRLNRLTREAAKDPGLRHVGRHVSVDIPDRRRVREAIEELKAIQQDLQKRLGPAP